MNPVLQHPLRALSLLILCTLPGCRSDADPTGRPEQAQGAAAAYQLMPEATIRAPDGEGPAAFSRIVDVALDAMGRVWVADGLENEIRIFQPDGTYVRTIGRTGAGPAEFGLLGGMDWAPDGNLWVVDVANARFSVWDTAGALVQTHPRRTSVSSVPWPGLLDEKGILYDQGASPVSGDGTPRIVRFGAGMQPMDTFRLPAFQEPMFELVTEQGNDRRISQVNVPYAGLQEWRLDRNGNVWIGVTDRYRIERHRFDGTVDRVLERAVRGRPVSRAERRSALRFLEDFQRRGGRIDAARIPGTLPVFNGFFFGDDASVWVVLATRQGEPPKLDVFDPAGRYLGAVTGPPRLTPSPTPVIRNGRMAAVVTDDDDVPSVVVLRVEKGKP